MRAFVFTDAKLERHAGRFVWLSMNTEETSAGPFLEKFPVDSWPSFFIIDSKTEKVALKWPGSATVPQLERLLDDGERSLKGNGKGPDGQLAAEDQAFAQGQFEEAARLGAQLAAKAPKDWAGRGRAVEVWILSLYELKQWETCAKNALQERDKLPRTPAYADVVAMGLLCADEMPKEAPARAGLLAPLEKAASDLAAKRDIAMAADDYSGLFGTLVDLREDRGDAEGARALADVWAKYLEGEAARATTPEGRSVFDPHRMTAYLKLKQPEKALAMLQESEKALPDDFNPPARMAATLKELGKYPEALAAADRALGLARGPRKLRIYSTRAGIQQKQGDLKGAKKTVDDALAFAGTLPKVQQYDGPINALKKLREEIAAAEKPKEASAAPTSAAPAPKK